MEKYIKYLDKSIPIKKRKEDRQKLIDKMLNPFDTFNPDDFEPLASEEEKEICLRERKEPPKELPTFGLKPHEIRVGQMIGMFESKQDIYLTFAHRCNELQKELDLLKQKVEQLEKQIK